MVELSKKYRIYFREKESDSLEILREDIFEEIYSGKGKGKEKELNLSWINCRKRKLLKLSQEFLFSSPNSRKKIIGNLKKIPFLEKEFFLDSFLFFFHFYGYFFKKL